MNTLHQQLKAKRRQIAAEELKANGVAGTLQSCHDAREGLPRLRSEAAALETDIELGEAAHRNLTHALSHGGTIQAKGRELALALTYAETAAWRLRNHLGDPSTPTVQAD